MRHREIAMRNGHTSHVPNRLVQTPPDLIDKMDDVLIKSEKEPEFGRYRLIRVVRLAYSRGYQDGYRDGHVDAENGHDERCFAAPA